MTKLREFSYERNLKIETAMSDIGSLKIGNETSAVLVNTGAGDGDCDFAILEDTSEVVCGIGIDFDYCGIVGTDIGVYDHDCNKGTPKYKLKPGMYSVYSDRHGFVLIHLIKAFEQ